MLDALLPHVAENFNADVQRYLQYAAVASRLFAFVLRASSSCRTLQYDDNTPSITQVILSWFGTQSD